MTTTRFTSCATRGTGPCAAAASSVTAGSSAAMSSTFAALPVTSLGGYLGRHGRAHRPGFPSGSTISSSWVMPSRTRWARSNRCARRSDARVAPRGKLTLLEASTGSEWARSHRARPARGSSSCGLAFPSPSSTSRSTGRGRLWLGRPDMRWTKQRVLLEYQGREFHDSDEQRAQDEVRFTRFSDDGWSVVRSGTTTSTPTRPGLTLVLSVADEARPPAGRPGPERDPSAVLQHPDARAGRDPARRLRARSR